MCIRDRDLASFGAEHPEAPTGDMLKKALPLERAGFLEIDGERMTLTRRGFLLSNGVIGEIVTGR